MRLHGHKRLDVFVPEELWERMEKARGESTRSEWVRWAIEQNVLRTEKNMVTTTITFDESYTSGGPDAYAKARKADLNLKTAREILKERTELLRQGKNVQ